MNFPRHNVHLLPPVVFSTEGSHPSGGAHPPPNNPPVASQWVVADVTGTPPFYRTSMSPPRRVLPMVCHPSRGAAPPDILFRTGKPIPPPVPWPIEPGYPSPDTPPLPSRTPTRTLGVMLHVIT